MLDVIEIDAASNTGVDNIRELIDRARFEPNQWKYKIYIIDEVHMLSKGAFNALLKTLEEPPTHVKFILATTEIDKVPETIRSRVQRFDFKKISREDITELLAKIAQSEGIDYEDSALALLARFAKGGLRDAITLFEQNILDGKLTKEHITHTLFIIDDGALGAILKFIIEGNVSAVVTTLGKLQERYIDVRLFFEQFLFFLKDTIYANLDTPSFWQYYRVFEWIEDAYGKLKTTPDPSLLLELTLIRLAKGTAPAEEVPQKITTPSGTEKPKTTTEVKAPVTPPPPQKREEKVEPTPVSSNSKEEEKKDTIETPVSSKPFSFAPWLTSIKTKKWLVYTTLKNARFEMREKTITFIFSRKWDYEQMNKGDILNFLAETITEFCGEPYEVALQIDERSSNSSLLSAAHEVF